MKILSNTLEVNSAYGIHFIIFTYKMDWHLTCLEMHMPFTNSMKCINRLDSLRYQISFSCMCISVDLYNHSMHVSQTFQYTITDAHLLWLLNAR